MTRGTRSWRGPRDQRGWDTALRARGRAVHGPCEVRRWRGWRRHVAWGHAGPRGRLWGAPRGEGGWWVKGPRVSGPWLEYWGGNAKALARSTFYTWLSPLFLPRGTMFPRVSSVQDTWRHRGGQRWSSGVDRVDPSPRDHWLRTCAKSGISDEIDGRHVASRWGINLHQTIAIHRDFSTSEGDTWTHLNTQWRSDGGNESWIMIMAHDRGSIVAW